jgi:hypothetical protein
MERHDLSERMQAFGIVFNYWGYMHARWRGGPS